MRRPSYSTPINFSALTRKVYVDNRISLRNYYRIADNLLKQANIYREEKNLIDLYVMLLRYSSLVSETILDHKDYQVLCAKERGFHRKKLLTVLDELEHLKPKVRHQLDEQDKVGTSTQSNQFGGPNSISYVASVNNQASLNYSSKQTSHLITAPSSSFKQNNEYTQFSSPNSIKYQFQKMSLSLPPPKQETLSRHSLLGPTGLRGQWLGPRAEVKVKYPTNIVVDSSEFSSLNQVDQQDLVGTKGSDSNAEKSSMDSVLSLDDGNKSLNQVDQQDLVGTKGSDSNAEKSSMDLVLSLDDGRWLGEESVLLQGNVESNDFQLSNIRQPSPPPVLAQVMPAHCPISPSRVADPRPGPPKLSQDGLPSSNSYQDLHIPVKLMDDFLRLARENTAKNLETCGVLAGSLKNRVFQITTLIMPKQESTSYSCEALNEEEIFEVQDTRSLFPLGWIHTHPTQTCFMSSVDLHTHYSYQVMLPEAIAIVMAPTDKQSPHGIFHLSDPGGVSVIRSCQLRGFHPHEEAKDGSPIYENCSHVYMNPKMKFDVVDLR